VDIGSDISETERHQETGVAMTKRAQGPTIAEDTDNLFFTYPCPECDEKRIERGRWFKERNYFKCRACGHNVTYTNEQLLRFMGEQVKAIKETFAQMRRDGTEKLD
jgi:transposase-like protein